VVEWTRIVFEVFSYAAGTTGFEIYVM